FWVMELPDAETALRMDYVPNKVVILGSGPNRIGQGVEFDCSCVHASFALSAEERKARVLASLAHYYGDEALRPVVYYESDWGTEEWTRGAYAASFDLGGLVRYGADQRAAVGPIRFASSDLAGHGYQHVDGAVRMGREAAAEILASLPQPAVR
ncbi:FAD-dependent oxidoreductase, partial [Bacillus sp. S34]|nr:FAD-dependent oxidoreductase [Bacillus sp. S34]